MKNISTVQTAGISQELLATVADLKRNRDEAERRYEEIRRSVLDLVDSGAEVEPGPLAYRGDLSERRRFSARELREILGTDEAERLRMLMPAHAVRILRVFRARGPEEDFWEADDRI
jgi:hypothetical protein